MKTEKNLSSSAVLTAGSKPDSTKLVSLLALAAGAAAMPQTSNADIIFSDQGATVSWEGTKSFSTSNLPGDVQLGFTAHQTGFPFMSTSSRWITGGARGGGYLKFKLNLVSQALMWDQIPGNSTAQASFASAGYGHLNGTAFSGLYMAFKFKDSTQPGTPLRYGWAQLSLANGDLGTGNNFPALTISGWAYDTTGTQIQMGQTTNVPEPSTMGLLALGALALGAKGLRAWRRNRPATQS